MVYTWCTACHSRNCGAENSHRASRQLQYRADFMVGGRYGKRIRKLFPTKKDAEAFEYTTLADYKRGLFIPQDKSTVSFKEFVQEYIEKKVKLYMRGAIVEEFRLNTFKEFIGVRPVSTITLNDWERYVKKRIEQGISKTTLNRELTGLKSMFKWGVKHSFIKNNPFQEATKFKEEIIKVRWLNDAEIEGVLQQCTIIGDLDMRDLLVVAMNTGFRKANLIELTANDISNQRIQAKKTKSGKSYEVPINRELAAVLNRLVLVHPTGSLLNFHNFRKRFKRVIAILKDPSVTLHTMRHTFAAQALKRGIPIDRVCAWLGHHSMEFTRKHYGHLAPSQEAIEIELLNLGRSKNLSPSVPSTLVRGLEDGGQYL